jgi:plasmid stabilization system protein ParE
MKVRFSPRAKRDLADIAGYIRSHRPSAGPRVRDTILASLEILRLHPEVGRRQNRPNVRKLVVNRYPYIIYYTPDSESAEIVVLAIQHTAQDRMFDDE